MREGERQRDNHIGRERDLKVIKGDDSCLKKELVATRGNKTVHTNQNIK